MAAESTIGTAHAAIVVDTAKMRGDITRAKTHRVISWSNV